MTLIEYVLSMPTKFLTDWTLWVIFFSALLESSPIVGILVPGQVIIAIAGFLAYLGYISLIDLAFIAALGAIAGDLLGYWIGKRYGLGFIRKYGKCVRITGSHIDDTKRMMNHHVGKSIVIGRFNSLTRSFAPFVSGMSDISMYKFVFYDIVGGVTWAITFSLIGFLFGQSYNIASRYVNGFFLILIVIMIAAIYTPYYFKKTCAKR
jgi:membrane-associated protein